ncbi:MAG: pyrimidine dimer DNA glycosylase/endonuclease V [Nanoarchaeota archaeon]|nr:pyrimidine dimer DNA glycosylase/endonuclease V [Nanoarchaeota archaeon]
MVRINIIHPKKLADQHLIAEYLEIMMLVGYTRNYPDKDGIPKDYRLGKGHIKFFKNKLIYLKNRHEEIRKEMKNRKFAVNKKIDLKEFDKSLLNDWKPENKDFEVIKRRIISRIKIKPNWYRYYGKKKSFSFFKKMISS